MKTRVLIEKEQNGWKAIQKFELVIIMLIAQIMK